jgi:hypothetical protein
MEMEMHKGGKGKNAGVKEVNIDAIKGWGISIILTGGGGGFTPRPHPF